MAEFASNALLLIPPPRGVETSLLLIPPTSWGGWHVVSGANDVTGGGLPVVGRDMRALRCQPHPTGLRPATLPIKEGEG